AGLLNGTRTFKVNLKNNIPSSVAVGGHNLTLLYAGHRKICYKCGHEGSQIPATTWHGVEREEVPAQTLSQDAVDPEVTTHPDGSENAVQETSTTCEAEIQRERNNVDQTKGKISCENMEYDKADDMEATNMMGTECEVARGGNMDRMEEIVEVTCIMSPSRNKNDANKKEQNRNRGKMNSKLTAMMMKIR
ncbi:hypothetical protein Hamer_G014921, partial [Homarus americanus]